MHRFASRSRLLHFALPTALLCTLAILILPAHAALAGSVRTERISVNSRGEEGDRISRTPSISADGRLIAFASEATNLVPLDSNGDQDIFLHDWSDGTTRRISVSLGGGDPDGPSAWPRISADGKWLVFSSQATNLVEGDTNGAEDIFLADLTTGAIERLSLPSAGGQANGASVRPVISADGRFVAFVSSATNLVAEPTQAQDEIYLLDRVSGELRWVSQPLPGAVNDGVSGEPAISADGNWVAFSSASSQLVSGDLSGRRDIFLWSRAAGSLTRVNVTQAGGEASRSSYHPSLSADGRYIAFTSYADNLVPDDTNFMGDIFRADRMSGAIERVNLSDSGAQALGGPSGEPAISDDGRFIVFRSDAANLVSNDSNSARDIFVRDMLGQTTLMSVDSDGHASNANSYSPAISADGAAVAFYSEADNLDLVRADNNGAGDVFAHGEPPAAIPTATPTKTPTDTPTAEPTPVPTDTPAATPTPTDTPTFTPTAEPTATPTDAPTFTPTAEPTATPTDTPTDTPTAEPTDMPTAEPSDTPTAEPTEPPQACSWTLDFETDAGGSPLAAGDFIDDEWAAFGIHITTGDPADHPAMIFDSAHPTGYDWDLGSPHEDFGGPGRGLGGAEGQPGENRWPLGNVLILSEDRDQGDPDDDYAGGTFIFTFDELANVYAVQLIDIDAAETTVKITAFAEDGRKLGAFAALPLGDNSVQQVLVQQDGVSRLEVHLQSSGAVAALSFCDPVPAPSDSPPAGNTAPVLEIKSAVDTKEGRTVRVNGSFRDPDSERWEASVDYGDGSGPQPLELRPDKTFKLQWTYGDDGDYEALVIITDEHGAQASASTSIHVKNRPPVIASEDPTEEISCDERHARHGDNGEDACEIGDWYVATVGEPTEFHLELEDAGSDDLFVTWSSGEQATYFSDGQHPDPFPSPQGTYPVHIDHEAAITFDKPGVQELLVTVTDDDGGKATLKLNVLVRDREACRSSLGYWMQRYQREGEAAYTGELRAHLRVLSAFIASSFDEFPPELLEAVQSFVLNDLDDEGRARAQLIAAWLNFTNGSVDWDETISDADGGHDLPYADVIRRILAILADEAATPQDIQHAIDLAQSINLHSHPGSSCPAYKE